MTLPRTTYTGRVPAFERISLKFDRGVWHARRALSLIEGYRNSGALPVVSSVEGHSGDQLWTVAGEPSPPPQELALCLGDALHNFRASLDYLAKQMVLLAGSVPNRSTGFPIRETVHQFKSDSGTKLSGMSKPMISAVRQWQPFELEKFNSYRAEALLELEHLDIADKHDDLVLVTAGSAGAFWPAGGAGQAGVGPMVLGAEVARFPAGHHQPTLLPVPEAAVKLTGPHDGQLVSQVLHRQLFLLPQLLEHFRAEFFPDDARILIPPV